MGKIKPRHNRVRNWPSPDQASMQAIDPIPQHTKMAVHTEANAAIRDFLRYMRQRGVELAGLTPVGTVVLTDEQIESAIFRFRDVDEEAYRVETAALMDKYGPVLLANLGFVGHELPDVQKGSYEQPSLIDDFADESIIRIIEILDRLGVPCYAGRPTCSQAIAEAGIALPDTALLARAVKFRKLMYENSMSQVSAPRSVTPVDHDADATSALLNKLRGNDE